MLRARNLSLRYRGGVEALREVSIALPVGRTVLLGPNGAGKSTLLDVLAGATAAKGSLELDGRAERPGRTSRSYRERVGWLPQDVVGFPGLTSLEHVAYAAWLKGRRSSGARAGAAEALERVGLQASSAVRTDRLSGGQRRRLGIASVLVHRPSILLLDEPTAGLDPAERQRLIDVVRSLEADHAVCIATHDVAGLIESSTSLLVIAGGSTRFAGSAAALAGDSAAGVPMERRVSERYAQLVSAA